MPKYFKVLSNLKHNGEDFKKDSIISGEMAQLEHLVKDGVLVVVEGAESLEDAKVLANTSITPEEAPEVPAAEPVNTWEAAKEPVVAVVPKDEKISPEVNFEDNKAPEVPGVVGTGDLPPADAGDNL